MKAEDFTSGLGRIENGKAALRDSYPRAENVKGEKGTPHPRELPEFGQ
jgi:hypothetical protein